MAEVPHDLVDVGAGLDHWTSANSRRLVRVKRRWLCERRDNGAAATALFRFVFCAGQALHCPTGKASPGTGELLVVVTHLPMLIEVDQGSAALAEVLLDKRAQRLLRVLDRRRIVVPRHLARPRRVGLLEEHPDALYRERRPLHLGDLLVLVGVKRADTKAPVPVVVKGEVESVSQSVRVLFEK